ncbi:MAG: low temperature requirement protein A, partial [Pseudonocardiales bacterium]|nr:low temperature requirement protein A [Pseudonocardiales bacterium]
ALAAAELHHALAEGNAAHAVAGYAAVFFGIWWAWVNFTWFASAYDTDDVPYRILTLVQMGGVLVFAAGIPAAIQASTLHTTELAPGDTDTPGDIDNCYR